MIAQQQTYKCDFCLREQHQVEFIVVDLDSTDKPAICSKCVSLAVERLEHAREACAGEKYQPLASNVVDAVVDDGVN